MKLYNIRHTVTASMRQNKLPLLVLLFLHSLDSILTWRGLAKGILLEEIWELNTLYSFYAVVARMFLASIILGIPFCISGIYMVKKNRKALGSKE